MAELSFTIDSFKTEIERKVDEDTLVSSIVAILDGGVGIKAGLDMANRLVLKLGKSESVIPSWEMPLCHHIVQVYLFFLLSFIPPCLVGIKCFSELG